MTAEDGNDIRERDDRGRYTPATTGDEILAALEPGEVYGTAEVAELVGISRRTALRRLDELAEAGAVRKRKLDPRRVVWIASE